MSDEGAMGNSKVPHRCLELLAGEVLGDLLPQEEQDLVTFRHELDLRKEREELETVAVAVQLAFALRQGAGQGALPETLRTKLLKDATRHLPGANKHEGSAAVARTNDHRNRHLPATVSSRVGLREAFAWISCAAALLLCLGLWSDDYRSRLAAVATNPSALRATLLESASTVRVKWEPGATPLASDVSGDITWNTSLQQGVMRFVDLPINDPTKEQYQLWIIDPRRDTNPIDGGVFNISSEGEVLVVVDAKLQVLAPQAFAITIEKPGGVVVSTQERLPLLATISET